jgi:anti-sigma B factor antagonist
MQRNKYCKMAYPALFFVSRAQEHMMDADELYMAEEVVDNVRVLTLSGELNIDTCPPLRNKLAEASRSGMATVVVLNHLSYLDSTGLGVLVGAKKRFDSHGLAMAVVCSETNNKIYGIFKVTGLFKALSARSTLAEAIAAVSPNRHPEQGQTPAN